MGVELEWKATELERIGLLGSFERIDLDWNWFIGLIIRSLVLESQREKWSLFRCDTILKIFCSSINILKSLDGESRFLTFLKRKREDRAIRSEYEIVCRRGNFWTQREVFEKINLCITSIGYIFHAIESTCIFIDRMRKIKLYSCLHIILWGECLQSRSCQSQCIKNAILKNIVDSIDSSYQTDIRSIKSIIKGDRCLVVLSITGDGVQGFRIDLGKILSYHIHTTGDILIVADKIANMLRSIFIESRE